MHKWFDCDDTQAKPFYKEKPKYFIWSTLITTMKTVPTDEFEKALREDAIKNNWLINEQTYFSYVKK